jgi:hypothetical protein
MVLLLALLLGGLGTVSAWKVYGAVRPLSWQLQFSLVAVIDRWSPWLMARRNAVGLAWQNRPIALAHAAS